MTVKKITLNTEKTTPIYEYPITLRQGDTSIQIPVDLEDDFAEKDLTKTKLVFLSDKPDATTIEDDEPSHFKIGADKQSFTYTFPDELTDASGSTTNTYFKIGNDSTSNFYIHILTKAGMEKLESGDYISKVDRIFNHVMSDYSAINDLSETAAATMKSTLDKMNSDYTTFINSKNTEFKAYLASLDKQATDVKNKYATLKTQLDALEIPQFGGRNLIVDADELNAGIGPNVKYGPLWDNRKVIMQDVPKVGDADMFSVNMSTYATSNCYTLSFWAKSSTDNNVVKCYFYNPTTTTTYYTSQGTGGNNADGVIPITLDKNWKWYWIVWNQKPSTEYKRILIGRMNAEYSTGTMYMTSPMLVEGNQPLPYVPAPEKKVNTFDTLNWQKTKITADDGGIEKQYLATNDIDLKKEMMNLPRGFHTFYAQPGVKNNPATSTGNPARGYVHITDQGDDHTLGNGIMGSLNSDEVWSIHVQYINGKYDDKSVVFNRLIKEDDTGNWQTQRIFRTGDYLLNACPKGTDFGEFLKSNNVPLGLSIIRDQNTNWNWRIEKESSNYIFGLSQDAGGTVYHLEVSNGTYQGYKTVMSNLTGRTLKLKDSTGKETTYTITGIS